MGLLQGVEKGASEALSRVAGAPHIALIYHTSVPLKLGLRGSEKLGFLSTNIFINTVKAFYKNLKVRPFLKIAVSPVDMKYSNLKKSYLKKPM